MTYLYNTLHYYERKLKDRPALKKKLVQAIIGKVSSLYKNTKAVWWNIQDAFDQQWLQYRGFILFDFISPVAFVPDRWIRTSH